MAYYSQNDEERVILEYFGDKPGRFLDIGAYDGIGFSNTRRLLENGWSGVYVEPSPENVLQLIKNSLPYSDRVQIVQAAVSVRRGLARFHIDTYPDRGWSSTISPALLELGSVMRPLALQVWTAVISMHDLDGPELGPYDFISLDCEGEDMHILQYMISNDIMLDDCRMICMECHSPHERDEIKGLLARLGFLYIYDTRENVLMAKPT